MTRVAGILRRACLTTRLPVRALLVAAAAASCARPATPPATATTPTAPVDARRANAWADSMAATLSLRDKVAQLVWPWILGDYVPEGSAEWGRLLRFVREEHVGGFIVSVGSPLDIASKLNALQRESALPLLVSADLETGAGFRARGGFFLPNGIELGGATVFPPQMAIGATGDSTLAYEVGRATARESRALGIHVAFGPVLDVNNNPANPVIGARSYGEDPALAARLGAADIRGLQDGGMLATGKHFPGHGDTETNSHLALAVVTASRSRLDSVELVPFRAAVRAGVGAIMTFHGFLPALDSSGVPATLSPRVMTDLLRRELGFDGLLFTDAMDMRGVVDKFGAAEAVKRAIVAGNDLVLMPSDIRGAIDAIVAGVAEGRYTEARLDASVRRVLALKAKFGLQRQRIVPLDSVRRIVGDSQSVALAQRIAERSIVLAKDSLSLVPLSAELRTKRVLAITYARRNDIGAGVAFAAELRRSVPALRAAYANSEELDPRFDAYVRMADSADVVVVASYVNISSETATAAAPRAFAEFVTGLGSMGKPVIVVSLGNPYLLQQIPAVSTYLIAWGGSTASQRAAARAIAGEIAIEGRLPIRIPPLLPLGAGLTRNARSGARAPSGDARD